LLSLKIKLFFMAKNTSIFLGDYFENYVNQKITPENIILLVK